MVSAQLCLIQDTDCTVPMDRLSTTIPTLSKHSNPTHFITLTK
uniref:Uncharacterized protein n=1 Tax=Anguilla anguilla TaxID=7936 RepID=A0A0E9S653_ANGAN